jgi:serine/threonine-protein kinase
MHALSLERRREIDRIFTVALECPPEKREALLTRTCGTDAELRSAVDVLLASASRAAFALGESATDFAAPLLSALPDEPEPPVEDLPANTVIGRYRIVREIGRGGMGAVYLAERADRQFERRVALKVVKRGMDTDEVMQRFRYERQILARLEHPGIARLYDGGVTPDGRPYLVMEFVEGRPLLAHCDELGLSVEHRLALFRAVCEAVQFAHQNLVVHRDIKPSNLMVTELGEVKLLDFGIAKLLDDAPGAVDTRGQGRIFTPEYASPEQLAGRPVTTASDTYSLGVVLYEQLTGCRPFDPGPVVSGEDEPDPSLLGRELGRPSAVAVPATVAADRGTTPEGLRRRLRGDLDTITSKALEADPGRRYPSAAALLDDIDRHLNGLPVSARQGGRAYRAAKFVRRHQTAVLAAGLVLLSLMGGLGTALWQARHAARQAARAERERDVAQSVSGFLEGLFQSSDPFAVDQGGLDTLRIRDFLAQGTAKVQRELRGQPAVEARMLHVLGEVYHNLGSQNQARPLLEEALRLRIGQHGAASAEVAETQTKLGILRRDLGDLAPSESLLRASLAVRRGLYGEQHADVGETLNELAATLRMQGEYDMAVRLHQQALASLRAATGPQDLKVILTLSELAATLGEKGEVDRAVGYAEEQLAVTRSAYGPGHPWVALALGNLSGQLQRKGDYEAAERHARESLAIAERTLGMQHPWVGEMLNIVGLILYRQEKYDEAEPIYRRSLAIKRAQDSGPSQSEGVGMFNLALLLRAKGSLDSAEAMNRRSLAMMREVVGDDHPSVAMQVGHLAVILQAKGDCRGALPLFEESIAGIQRSQSSAMDRVGQLQSDMGACLTALGRYPEAESALIAGHALLAKGRKESAVAAALERLVALYSAWGKPERAAEYRAIMGQPSPDREPRR